MRVYSVVGVPPEIQAYAMAKYSRSAQSMAESIGELSQQRAEEFLNTFYFQYGHRSIADLAHLVLGIEDISILAAIRLVDEPVWDGQERSTRYQDFRKSGYHTPEVLTPAEETHYIDAVEALFAEYQYLSRELTTLLVNHHPRPADLDARAFERTLRARAFDVARYCLPMATRTSVGQVISARVVERQISRLLGDPYPEVRAIGEALRTACRQPAYSPAWERFREAREAANGHAPENNDLLGLATELLRPPAAAPTLVKYTAPADYADAVDVLMRETLARYAGRLPAPDRTHTVELAEPETPEDEALASLLYGVGDGQSYRQLQALVATIPAAERAHLLEQSFALRGRHDELLRAHRTGYALKADLLIDLGAYRDFHRHRRCVQIAQPLTWKNGAESARALLEAGFGEPYAALAGAAGLDERLEKALAAGGQAAAALAETNPLAAPYLLPLGYRIRCLFKMDLAEAAYITELRTGAGGHFSYRRAAYDLNQALVTRWPGYAGAARVSDPYGPPDLLQR